MVIRHCVRSYGNQRELHIPLRRQRQVCIRDGEEYVTGLDSPIWNGVPNGIGFQARDWSQSQVRRFGEFKPVLNPV